MAAGLSPYVQAAQRNASVTSPYAGGTMGGQFGRYRPNLESAVTGPTGTGGTGGGAEAMAEEEQRLKEQQLNQANVTASRQEMEAGQSAASQNDQAKDVAAYRQARDTSGGSDDANVIAAQRTQAKQLGIDPSSSAPDIAAAASGKTQLDPNNPNGIGTGAGTPAALAPNSADVATAAAATQNAKDGGQDAALANSYAGGFNGGQKPTGNNPFTATPNAAMPPMPSLTYNPPPSSLAPAPVPTPAPAVAAKTINPAPVPPLPAGYGGPRMTNKNNAFMGVKPRGVTPVNQPRQPRQPRQTASTYR